MELPTAAAHTHAQYRYEHAHRPFNLHALPHSIRDRCPFLQLKARFWAAAAKGSRIDRTLQRPKRAKHSCDAENKPTDV